MFKPDPSFFAPSTHRCVGGLQLNACKFAILSYPYFFLPVTTLCILLILPQLLMRVVHACPCAVGSVTSLARVYRCQQVGTIGHSIVTVVVSLMAMSYSMHHSQ